MSDTYLKLNKKIKNPEKVLYNFKLKLLSLIWEFEELEIGDKLTIEQYETLKYMYQVLESLEDDEVENENR